MAVSVLGFYIMWSCWMRQLYQFMALVIFSFLYGCVATGPTFGKVEKYADNNATIYIFRQSAFVGSAACPYIDMDSNRVGCLEMDGFWRLSVAPGTHVLEVVPHFGDPSTKPKLSFNVAAGDVKFFEWSLALNSMMYVAGVATASESEYLTEYPEEKALPLLSGLKESSR